MAGGRRSAAGTPPISFHSHLVRAGEAGARGDFEQMLALLVPCAGEDGASLVAARPGDWGIDVLVGDLNGRVRIWQAKFFVGGFGASQRGQVRESFQSAMAAAERHGHRVERWTLCVPCSLDAPSTRWWQSWSAREGAGHGVAVDLWDETVLRRLLLLPEASTVRSAYYDPYTTAGAPAREVARAAPVERRRDPAATWRAGDELRLGAAVYLLCGDPSVEGPVRAASAEAIDPRFGRVWLRQVRDGSPAPQSAGLTRAALRAQADLLRRLAGAGDLPRPLDLHEEPDATTLVVAQPAAPTWREHCVRGADLFVAAWAIGAALSVCAALHELHRRGCSHRALSADSVLLVGGGRRAVLRDAGLAGVPPHDPRADVHQLAALLHETLTGLPASSRAALGAAPTGVRGSLDELLARALDPDPGRRPETILLFSAGLRAARTDLVRGARS